MIAEALRNVDVQPILRSSPTHTRGGCTSTPPLPWLPRSMANGPPLLWDHRCLSPEPVSHHNQPLVHCQTHRLGAMLTNPQANCSSVLAEAGPAAHPTAARPQLTARQPAKEMAQAWILPNNFHMQPERLLVANAHLQRKEVRRK